MTWQPPEPTMVTHFDHGPIPKGDYYTLDQLLAVRRDTIEEYKCLNDFISLIAVSEL